MKKNNFLTDYLSSRRIFDGSPDKILDALPVGVEIYAKDGTLLYISETDARIFGVDRDVLMASNINLFDNPNLPLEVKNALINCEEIHKRILYNFDIIIQKNYYNSTGRSRFIYIEYNGRPIVGEDGELESYVFIIEDVTEVVRKEKELKQSKRKTELAIRESGIMLWEFDVYNKEFYSDNDPLNAYDRSNPITTKLYKETVHPDDREKTSEVINRMISGEDFSFSFNARILFPGITEWQYCTITGSPYERDAQGRTIKYVGVRKNNTDLQKRELLQEKILNSIPLPILIKDVEDNFHYVFCNDESKRLFGTSEEKTTYDLMSAEHVARIEKTDKEVFATGNPYFGLERIILKDGRSYDTVVRKSVIYDGDHRLLLNIRWDQSLQNELERRAKLLSMSMETMNAYSWFYELEKNYISYGEGFDRSGRDASQLNSFEKFVSAVHPDDRLEFSNSINAVIERESGKWEMEYRIDFEGSGNYEWWQTQGLFETTLRDEVKYKYMYGMSINIDTHKQTELTLLRNKQKLDMLLHQNELVLNNTNSGLAYITTDYIVQWENISVCSKSITYEAYKKGEFCYKSAHGRNAPCKDCVLQRAIRSGQLERIKFTLNGGHTIEIFATPVFKEEKVDGIVIRVDDITEREQMIKDLNHARVLAEESDRLKSAFLANMSHEIRTPLNAIIGFSELLVSTPELEDKEEYIRIINNNNELLLKLINDILDLSKIEAGTVDLKYEEFDLAEYFNGMAMSMKQRVTNPKVRLLTVSPYNTCNVRLDKNRVAQIITNYVTNAIKYTPKGFIEMGYESLDGGIRFYVSDSGIGIPEEKKNKVFHRFEKLDEFAQGTGLGLSICKAIAESMGGKVGFESESNEGSLFWAFLPCSPEIGLIEEAEVHGVVDDAEVKIENQNFISDVCPPDTEHRKQDLHKRCKVLVAEDIASNFLLVSSFLKEQYDLVHARNGKEAVELARSSCPDLVLMDMKMPIMNGMEATVEIRKFDSEVSIVALTAHAFESDRLAALAAGCDEYLVKPINKEQLLNILQKYADLVTVGRKRE